MSQRVALADVTVDHADPALTQLLVDVGVEIHDAEFPDQLGIFAGNPRTIGRRFILLLFGKQNEQRCIVKAGIGEAAKQLIEREQSFLASAPPALAGVPKLFGTFCCKNVSAFAMEFLDGEFPTAADTGMDIGHAGRGYSLLEVTIKTGRTHQIRVHLASEGMPIAGDDKYGDFDCNKALARANSPTPLKRMFLHAKSFTFEHPVTHAETTVEAPLPSDLADFWYGAKS